MRTRLLPLFILLALLSACGPAAPTAVPPSPIPPTPIPPTPVPSTALPTAGLADPASIFCLDQGGTLQIRTAPDGSQTGYCVFPDGTSCEEWAYFRGECGPGARPTPVSATPTPNHLDDLQLQVQQSLPDGAYEGFTLLPLDSPAGFPTLVLAYSYGMRNYELDPSPGHFLALYTWDGTLWQEVAHVSLDEAYPPGGSELPTDYLPEGGVRQVQLSPDRIWLQVEGGTGAHSGTFYLLAYDGRSLQTYVAQVSSSYRAGELSDLDGDGFAEVILNQTDYYIFCYACGVTRPDFQVLHWDRGSKQMVEITLQPLTAGQPQPLRDLVDAAVALAGAGLWKDAMATINQARVLLAQYPEADAQTLAWDYILIRLHAEAMAQAVSESPYPLIENVFYGDYAAAVDLMRAYQPEQIFAPDTPLIIGTVAEGWDVSGYILAGADAAVALQPDLAAAYFLRGWAAYVADPSNVQARRDVERAAELAPADSFYSQCAGYLRSLP